jgi:hypothetical protein
MTSGLEGRVCVGERGREGRYGSFVLCTGIITVSYRNLNEKKKKKKDEI